jgi:hypothetical protein
VPRIFRQRFSFWPSPGHTPEFWDGWPSNFCRTGKHREHDVFADMEAADLRSGLETAVAARGFPAIEEVFSAYYSVFYGQ